MYVVTSFEPYIDKHLINDLKWSIITIFRQCKFLLKCIWTLGRNKISGCGLSAWGPQDITRADK